MKLSAYLIVKNEEAVLAKCLDRLKQFDEIVVVDTGSTDGTVEVFEQWCENRPKRVDTVRLDKFTWIDDFSAARNFAASLCTGDWLFPIDADNELVTSRSKIRETLERAEKKGATTCNIRAQYPGGNWHWVSGFHKPGAMWVGAVHECITPAPQHNADVTIMVGQSPAKAGDPERNLRILLKSDLGVSRNMFYLAKEYFERGRYGNALAWFDAYLQSNARTEAEIHWAWLMKAYCYWHDGSGRGDKARECGMEALRQNPASKETIRLLAEMHNGAYREKWARLEKAADDEGVLFVR